MHKLSPQQRIAAYEWAAERIRKNEGSNSVFICCRLRDYIYKKTGTKMDASSAMKLFPELIMFLDGEGYAPLNTWENETRYFILGSCILMAEEEISKQGKK